MAEDKNPFLGKSKEELDSLIKSGKYAGKEALQLAEAWREVLNIIEDTTIATQDLTSKMAELLKINEKEGKLNKERLAIFTRTVDAFSPLNTKAGNLYNIYNNLKDPVTAVYQMIELSAKRFVELDNAAESFRKTTGFLASQTSVVEATISRTSRDLASFGVTAENAGVAAQKIAESFSSTALVTDEIVGHVALMEQNLGVAVEDSTSVMQNFMGIGKMSADVANKTAGAAASLAKAAGVPFAKVMKDVATAGGEVLKLVRGSVDALVKGAVEARRLGLELKDVGAAADKFLDFQTSINSEMEASVLFGKDINFTRARELAYAGDLAGLAKEQSRILKEVGDLRKLDAFQTKALAESMGLSVDQLVKMNAKQEELNELRRKNPDLAAQYEKDLDVLDKTNESLEEKYKKEIRSRQIASQQTKILNDINQIITQLAELFLPVVSIVMGILVGLIKVSSVLITGIMSPITYLYDAFRYVTTEVFDLNKFLSETSNTMSGISAKIGEWVKAITAIGVTLAVVFGREQLRTMILNGIAGPFKIALGFMDKYKEKVKDIATNVASKIAGGAGSAIPTPTTGAGGVTGGGTSKFVEGVKAIDPKMLLSLGVAMVAFAGSVLILAHAAKVFGSPEAQAGFSSMAIAAIGLAVITAALVGLSTLITTASPIIVPAIGIMLGFAAAVGVLSLAAMGFGKAFQMFVEGFERAIEIDLFSLAAGFYVLSGAIASFGASMAIGGMGSFLGGGMMLQLVALAAISPGLILASDALSSIGATLQMFKDETIVEGIENITEAVKGLNKEINNVSLLNIAGLSTIGTIGKNAAGGGDEVVSKLDELIELMKSGGIAVNIDGSKVSTAVGVATKFRGSF
jgi:hypothetical protein